jgi:hypothetical protein
MRTIQKALVISAVAFAANLITSWSWAGVQEQAAAEALFQDARQLMKNGQYAEACPKLFDSNRLDTAVGTLLYLGECYEKSGKTASAWSAFLAAAESAHKAGQLDRARVASDRANALVNKLSKISISVSAAARVPGLAIHRDEVEVSEATWGVAVPLDAGEHVIVAKAPGKKDWSRTVRIEASDGPILVEIPMLENAKAPNRQQPALRADVNKAPVADAMSLQGRGNSQRTLAYVAGGVGVAGWLVGAVAGLKAKSKQNQSESQCVTSAPNYCNQQGVDLLSTGRKYAAVANVGFAAGALGVVGGALLYFTSPTASVPTAALTNFERLKHGVSITPTIDAKSTQLWVTGSF